MSVAVERHATAISVPTAAAAVHRRQRASSAPRPSPASWPATRAARDEVLERLTGAPFVPDRTRAAQQHARARACGLLLDWLADQPGATWQDRWLASGADAAGADWRQVPDTSGCAQRGTTSRRGRPRCPRRCRWRSAPT